MKRQLSGFRVGSWTAQYAGREGENDDGNGSESRLRNVAIFQEVIRSHGRS